MDKCPHCGEQKWDKTLEKCGACGKGKAEKMDGNDDMAMGARADAFKNAAGLLVVKFDPREARDGDGKWTGDGGSGDGGGKDGDKPAHDHDKWKKRKKRHRLGGTAVGWEFNQSGSKAAANELIANTLSALVKSGGKAGVEAQAATLAASEASRSAQDPSTHTQAAQAHREAGQAHVKAARLTKSSTPGGYAYHVNMARLHVQAMEEHKLSAAPDSLNKTLRMVAPTLGMVRKDMNTVSRFADLLASIGWLINGVKYEAGVEGDQDDEAAVNRLRAWLADGVEIFQDYCGDQTEELLTAVNRGVGEMSPVVATSPLPR